MTLKNNKILMEQWKKTLADENIKQSTKDNVKRGMDDMIASHPEVLDDIKKEEPKETKSKKGK